MSCKSATTASSTSQSMQPPCSDPKSPLMGIPSSLSALKKRKTTIQKQGLEDSTEPEDEILFSRSNSRMGVIKQEPSLIKLKEEEEESHHFRLSLQEEEGFQWEDTMESGDPMPKRTLKSLTDHDRFVFEFVDCHHHDGGEYESLVEECNKMMQSEW
ncbi:hypothetical protein FDP41_010885 [Naegleria fowleri]|uniref:Uncharacterized protein n=1 Tax=Naegleria fowleri TaxID=5763 RepID=A0A6A5C8Q6_NAEFO|nr:uncharacterized protein FDP41_010883 [Naegleria fowleri]XP_044567619.1 uncharacterized protein FDP41_010885 [Naegleria fowleri]KAF0982904.1 hypothetical protein FDP41_010883 [Naegleria fowleri]KAF0982906.1 hypothetical protein FDP41_010885 [Naegleria fowleri]